MFSYKEPIINYGKEDVFTGRSNVNSVHSDSREALAEIARLRPVIATFVDAGISGNAPRHFTHALLSLAHAAMALEEAEFASSSGAARTTSLREDDSLSSAQHYLLNSLQESPALDHLEIRHAGARQVIAQFAQDSVAFAALFRSLTRDEALTCFHSPFVEQNEGPEWSGIRTLPDLSKIDSIYPYIRSAVHVVAPSLATGYCIKGSIGEMGTDLNRRAAFRGYVRHLFQTLEKLEEIPPNHPIIAMSLSRLCLHHNMRFLLEEARELDRTLVRRQGDPEADSQELVPLNVAKRIMGMMGRLEKGQRDTEAAERAHFADRLIPNLYHPMILLRPSALRGRCPKSREHDVVDSVRTRAIYAAVKEDSTALVAEIARVSLAFPGLISNMQVALQFKLLSDCFESCSELAALRFGYLNGQMVRDTKVKRQLTQETWNEEVAGFKRTLAIILTSRQEPAMQNGLRTVLKELESPNQPLLECLSYEPSSDRRKDWRQRPKADYERDLEFCLERIGVAYGSAENPKLLYRIVGESGARDQSRVKVVVRYDSLDPEGMPTRSQTHSHPRPATTVAELIRNGEWIPHHSFVDSCRMALPPNQRVISTLVTPKSMERALSFLTPRMGEAFYNKHGSEVVPLRLLGDEFVEISKAIAPGDSTTKNIPEDPNYVQLAYWLQEGAFSQWNV